jgi:serine/threonine protein kinase
MKQAASVMIQAALGLAYAHQQGLVHRDVKPGNLLVTPEGLVKVSDLGLAGFLHEGENDPRSGKIVGTADYLAPEKITEPQVVQPVSDIYSLGCTLYYAITGKVPFPGGSTREKARRHCEETPWHPRQFNPEISDEFVDLIADMMEKDPQKRIQTADEVAQRLDPWSDVKTTLPHPTLTKSPWLPPPLPTGREDTVDDFADLARRTVEAEDAQASAGDSNSQGSQGTYPLTSSGHDTDYLYERPVIPVPPPVPRGWDRPNVKRTIARTLAIAIPLSFLAGSLLTYLLLR